MKRVRVVAGLTVALIGFGAGPAAAWDCLRFGSEQGLQSSTTSGNWEYLSLDQLVAGGVEDGIVTQQQGDCIAAQWRADGTPEHFAIGIGVAGANGAFRSGHIEESDFFVLAMNMSEENRADGHGVDHLEALLGTYMAACHLLEPPPDH